MNFKHPDTKHMTIHTPFHFSSNCWFFQVGGGVKGIEIRRVNYYKYQAVRNKFIFTIFTLLEISRADWDQNLKVGAKNWKTVKGVCRFSGPLVLKWKKIKE